MKNKTRKIILGMIDNYIDYEPRSKNIFKLSRKDKTGLVFASGKPKSLRCKVINIKFEQKIHGDIIIDGYRMVLEINREDLKNKDFKGTFEFFSKFYCLEKTHLNNFI